MGAIDIRELNWYKVIRFVGLSSYGLVLVAELAWFQLMGLTLRLTRVWGLQLGVRIQWTCIRYVYWIELLGLGCSFKILEE